MNEVSVDAEGQYVASCGDDGTVVVICIDTGESSTYTYNRPMTTVKIDPLYAQKREKLFVAGNSYSQCGYKVLRITAFRRACRPVCNKSKGMVPLPRCNSS